MRSVRVQLKTSTVLFFTFFLSGCIALPIPHERKLSPLFFGQVIDEDSRQPIEGVEIEATSLSHSSETDQPQKNKISSNANGDYEISVTEKANWFVIIGLPVDSLCGGSLLFSHPSYEPRSHRASMMVPRGGNAQCWRVKYEYDVSLKKKRQ